MRIFQSRSFERKIKKLSKSEKKILDEQVKKIAENPSMGVEKKGDLQGVFIYKLKIKSVQYLLAYRLKHNGLELIMIGPHENYYRNLKSYLKNK